MSAVPWNEFGAVEFLGLLLIGKIFWARLLVAVHSASDISRCDDDGAREIRSAADAHDTAERIRRRGDQ
jgi:hypothetical protein